MSIQNIPMEEVGRATSHDVLIPPRTANSMGELYDGQRRSSILRKLGSFIRECIEAQPTSIPVSPRTRQAANTEQTSPRRTVRLWVVSLPAVLHRESVGVEALEGQPGKLRLTLIIDSASPTVIRHTDAKGKMQDNPALSINEGMRQLVTLDITLKGKVRQLSVILRSSKDESSPHQASVIVINPPVDRTGPLEAKVINQVVKWGDRELEYLEIFDQPSQESKLGTDNTDCVICLTAKRNTVMLPCRHMCACLECAEALSTTNGTCPICRQTFSNMMTVTEDSSGDPSYKSQKGDNAGFQQSR